MLVPIALRRPVDLSSSLKINSADCQLRPATTRPRYLLVRCRCADAWHALGTGLFEDQSSVPRIASQILSLWTKVAFTGARSTRRENRAAACCRARVTVKTAYLCSVRVHTYLLCAIPSREAMRQTLSSRQRWNIFDDAGPAVVRCAKFGTGGRIHLLGVPGPVECISVIQRDS